MRPSAPFYFFAYLSPLILFATTLFGGRYDSERTDSVTPSAVADD